MRFFHLMTISTISACLLCTLALAESTSSPETKTPDKIVAWVGTQKVLQSELRQFTKNIPPQFQAAFEKKALEQIIEAKVFYQLAKAEKIDKTQAYIEQLETARIRLMAQNYIDQKLKSRITISDAQIKAYYQNNVLKKSDNKIKIHVKHITTKSMEEARAIKTRLNQGAPFDKIMENKSQEFGKFKGGDLGWITKGKMPPEFTNAAFALEKDQVSSIVKTKIGYHIIKLVDRQEVTVPPLEQIKGQIRNELISSRLSSLKNEQKEKFNIRYISDKSSD